MVETDGSLGREGRAQQESARSSGTGELVTTSLSSQIFLTFKSRGQRSDRGSSRPLDLHGYLRTPHDLPALIVDHFNCVEMERDFALDEADSRGATLRCIFIFDCFTFLYRSTHKVAKLMNSLGE